MTLVYIAIGGNLDNPIEKVRNAIFELKRLPETRFISCSSLYSSKPMGPADQPDYVNAVALIETSLPPLTLLDQTQQIETMLGRVRKAERWGPRTLDLDILLYGDQQINHERLIVPHYGMKVREFVLYPLAEISPNLTLPDGSLLVDLISDLDSNELTIID